MTQSAKGSKVYCKSPRPESKISELAFWLQPFLVRSPCFSQSGLSIALLNILQQIFIALGIKSHIFLAIKSPSWIWPLSTSPSLSLISFFTLPSLQTHMSNLLIAPMHRVVLWFYLLMCFPQGPSYKENAYNVGELGLIPGSGRSPGGGHGNSLQCSCHGQRRLVGYSPWDGRVRHDQVTHTFTLSCSCTYSIYYSFLHILPHRDSLFKDKNEWSMNLF